MAAALVMARQTAALDRALVPTEAHRVTPAGLRSCCRQPHTHWSSADTACPQKHINIHIRESTQAPESSSLMSAFGEAYAEALQELTTSELPKIKLLRDLARENPEHAPAVVKALADHAFKCPPSHRLPALYLMDCILKSAEGTYPALLANVLGQVFSFIWDGATPDLRHKLVKTAGTWKDHLPASVMASVCAKMQPPAPVPSYVGTQQSLLFATGGTPVNPLVAPTTSGLPRPAASTTPLVLNVAGQPMVLSGGSAFPVVYPTQHAYGGVLAPAPAGPTLPALQPAPVSSAAPASSTSALSSSLIRLGQQLGIQGAALGSLPVSAPVAVRTGGSSGGSGGAPQASLQAAVDALCAASEATKPKFRDLQFLRNRRKQTQTHQVRHWYSNVDEWLQGTRTIQDGPLQVFEDQAASQMDSVEPQVAQVEEDPSQPFCAISGEVFERTYDPDTDKWYYEDAMVLTGDQAAAYGVMDGSIVKVHCLAGTPPVAPARQGMQSPAAVQPAVPVVVGGAGDARQAPVPVPTTKESPAHTAPSSKDSQAEASKTGKRAHPESEDEPLLRPPPTGLALQPPKRIKVDG